MVAQFDNFLLIFVDAFGLFCLMTIADAFEFVVDAVQRYSGLNIRFDDSVGAQLDIFKDFSYFLLIIFVFC